MRPIWPVAQFAGSVLVSIHIVEQLGDAMKKKEVPQDNSPTYKGYGTKVLYAVDDDGSYTTVEYNGWEAEEIVLRDVVNDFKARAREAAARVLDGQASPIEYYMHLKLMDLPSLAYGVGLARWRVKRHLTARGFKRLDHAILERYAEFFNIKIESLTRFKEHTNVE